MKIKSVDLKHEVLDYLSQRHELLTNNIANATTPNFKRNDITFKEGLEKETNKITDVEKTGDEIKLKTIHEKHFSGENSTMDTVKPFTEINTIQNNNGNNVDIEKEMLEITKNTQLYGVLASKVAGTYSKVKNLFKDS
jgi:flagellar basal-body rod protein FlgB